MIPHTQQLNTIHAMKSRELAAWLRRLDDMRPVLADLITSEHFSGHDIDDMSLPELLARAGLMPKLGQSGHEKTVASTKPRRAAHMSR